MWTDKMLEVLGRSFSYDWVFVDENDALNIGDNQFKTMEELVVFLCKQIDDFGNY